MEHKLLDLPYSYDALEVAIDAQTMEIHHTKHHQAYIANLNKALLESPTHAEMSLEKLLTNLDKLPESIRTVVRNNAGGHYNHSLFWQIMTPDKTTPSGSCLEAIKTTFTSLEKMQEDFNTAALGRFGSGWAWLYLSDKTLKITSTPNQDNPVMEGFTPILGLDVWEHAYYLKYQNKRADYVQSWWQVVNWNKVQELYDESNA